MSGPDDDQDELPLRRHVVSAADASPLHTAAASSVFNWRGAGSAAAAEPEIPAAQTEQPPQPEREENMATTTKSRKGITHKTRRGGPQLQICKLLVDGGMGRDAIGAALADLTSAQISSALNNSKAQGRIAFVDSDSTYRLTKAGQAWVGSTGDEQQGGAEQTPATKGRGRRSKAHARGTKRTKTVVDTSPKEPTETADTDFRCAVMSDGCFFISKDGNSIELDADEHAHMLAYLERMAEATA